MSRDGTDSHLQPLRGHVRCGHRGQGGQVRLDPRRQGGPFQPGLPLPQGLCPPGPAQRPSTASATPSAAPSPASLASAGTRPSTRWRRVSAPSRRSTAGAPSASISATPPSTTWAPPSTALLSPGPSARATASRPPRWMNPTASRPSPCSATSCSRPIPDLDCTDFLLILGANPAVSNGSLMTAPGVGSLHRGHPGPAAGRWCSSIPRRSETAALASAHHLPSNT